MDLKELMILKIANMNFRKYYESYYDDKSLVYSDCELLANQILDIFVEDTFKYAQNLKEEDKEIVKENLNHLVSGLLDK